MRPSALAVLRNRLRLLDRGLKAGLDADVEGVHRARVATRRLREALPILAGHESREPVKEIKPLIREITRALGRVREADVTLALIARLSHEQPELLPALTLVSAAIASERLAQLQRMRERIDAGRLRRASRALAAHMRRHPDAARPAERLVDRLRDRAEDLRRAVDAAGLLYASERLHAVRVATKKLRYVLELAGEIHAASTRRLVTELRRMQDCLGLLHDLEVVATYARRTLGQPDPPAPAARVAASTLSLLEDRIHAQHADYLVHREVLLRVVARALALRERMQATA